MKLSSKQKITLISLSAVSVLLGVGYILFVLVKKTKNDPAGFAERWIGEEETSANAGFKNPEFEQLMEAAGWYKGAEWCSFFVKMLFLNATEGEVREIALKLISGSTQQTFANFSNNKNEYFEISSKPKINGIVIWQNNSNTSAGHTGIITKVGSDFFETVEGNSNSGGSQGIVKRNRYDLAGTFSGKSLRGFINLK